MTSDDVTVRIGSAADTPAVLGFFDRAIAWLVERGRIGQWGSAPFSSEPRQVERVHGWAGSGGELVRYYERAGFTPTERFTVGDWEGQVLIRRCDEP